MRNYFDISELTASDTAKVKGINNTPNLEVCDRLHLLITECLNPIREAYGKPITVTSGYRCERLNFVVGGKSNSQHIKGEAADLVGKNDEETRRIFEIARALGNFDQLLFERSGAKRWVHISYKKIGNRKQAIDNYNV
jgi:hypothetical protein